MTKIRSAVLIGLGLAVAVGCGRSEPEALPAEWTGTLIGTYCVAAPCPPGRLTLGSPGGDTLYGGVPSMLPGCNFPRAAYPLAAADVESGGVDFTVKTFEYGIYGIGAPIWMHGRIDLAALTPGGCNDLKLEFTERPPAVAVALNGVPQPIVAPGTFPDSAPDPGPATLVHCVDPSGVCYQTLTTAPEEYMAGCQANGVPASLGGCEQLGPACINASILWPGIGVEVPGEVYYGLTWCSANSSNSSRQICEGYWKGEAVGLSHCNEAPP